MTEFYRLLAEMRIPGKWYLNEILSSDGKEVPPELFKMGKPVEPVTKLTVVPNVKGNPVDFTWQTFAVLVVSKPLAEFIEQFDPGAIQRIPVTIAPDQGGFEILNIVKLVDCLDFEASEIQRHGIHDPPKDQGKIAFVDNLHIIPSKATGHHIFRIGEWPFVVIISGALKTALESKCFTGMRFVPL